MAPPPLLLRRRRSRPQIKRPRRLHRRRHLQPAGEEKEEKKEKTAFDVKLEGFDAAAKIKVIKEVRGFTELGLKEAKELVEKAPVVVKSGVTKEEAEKIVEKLKGIGAKVAME
ncbi:uncharacterized protein LOC109820938 [Asparagus officinalis]|uniref:uncharacterized protein LOC109820938 n=1 Tax=Asparagus officinalis TaxID=4686 RepID=UPI00098E0A50|nr:uncharacterized protein LOC109820938 [Asparagus officinalis]